MAIYQITNPALLGQLYAGLQRHLTNPADPVRLAAALCAELPALDAAEAADAAQRIVQGVQHGRQLLHRPAFTTAQSMEQLLPVLTDEITSAERKGFYLILYEAYRQSDREVCTAAGAAPPDHTLVPGMDEEGLCRLAARQLELHAADLFTGQRDDTSLSAAEPELMAAAMFAAHKKGALNSPLAQDASLLGFACGAAAELRSIDQEEAARMVHLLLAALAAAAVI